MYKWNRKTGLGATENSVPCESSVFIIHYSEIKEFSYMQESRYSYNIVFVTKQVISKSCYIYTLPEKNPDFDFDCWPTISVDT